LPLTLSSLLGYAYVDFKTGIKILLDFLSQTVFLIPQRFASDSYFVLLSYCCIGISKAFGHSVCFSKPNDNSVCLKLQPACFLKVLL